MLTNYGWWGAVIERSLAERGRLQQVAGRGLGLTSTEEDDHQLQDEVDRILVIWG